MFGLTTTKQLEKRISELEKRSTDDIGSGQQTAAQNVQTMLDYFDDMRATGTPSEIMLNKDQLVKTINVSRAIQIHTTTIKQLPLNYYTKGTKEEDPKKIPPLIIRPTVTETRETHHEKTIFSLLKHGNAYWLKHYPIKEVLDDGTQLYDFTSQPTHVERLAAKYVTPEPEDFDPTKIRRYAYNPTGKKDGIVYYYPQQIQHLAINKDDDELLGISPLDIGAEELSAAKALQDYVNALLSKDTTPTGTVEGDDDVTPDIADQIRTEFNKTHGGKAGVAVLGNGFTFNTQNLNPEQLQWIQARNYDVITCARLLGVPASIMLAFIEGTVQAYQNVSQDWLGFIRFSAANLYIEIENAYNDMLVGDKKVRFNVEALLRADALTRWQIYKLNKEAGEIITRPEIRALEDLDPTDQRDFADLIIEPSNTPPANDANIAPTIEETP